MFLESVRLAVGYIAFAAEDLKVQVKHFVQLTVPVIDQTSRHNHQRTLEFAPTDEFSQEERRLNSLAEAYFIGNEETARRGCCYTMREHHLMRKQVNLGRG